MPYKDPRERREATQRWRERHPNANGPGRPTVDDKQVLYSVRLRASIVGRLERLLLEGMARGTYPWKTRSQQAADLLIRGLETLREESAEEALQYLRAVRHSESIRRHRREAQSAWTILNEELTELKAIGATAQAVHQFWASYGAFEAMSPSTWRDWLLTKLRETHQDLYRQQPPELELVDRDEEDPHDRPVRKKVVALKSRKAQ